jgi:chromosome segregation ATPase
MAHHDDDPVAEIGLTYGDVKRIEDKLDAALGHLDHDAIKKQLDDIAVIAGRVDSNQAVLVQQGTDIKAAIADQASQNAVLKSAIDALTAQGAEVKAAVDALAGQAGGADIKTALDALTAQVAELKTAVDALASQGVDAAQVAEQARLLREQTAKLQGALPPASS